MHFKNLLGNEPIVEGSPGENITPAINNLMIPDGPFTREEYAKVKNELKNGKACRPDGILPEVFKYCDLDDIMLEFANNLLNGHKPAHWSKSDFKPLPKSGDLSSTENYRGISLSATSAKIVNKLILNRIRPLLDQHLRNNQNGFRPGRSATTHILAIRRLIEEVRSKNLKAAIVFIDFKQAFDGVHRVKMLKMLKAYGIPDRLISAIGLMYEGTQARVITPDEETEFFSILAGVL